MDKTLSNEAIELLSNDMKNFAIEDVAKISDHISSLYGEVSRERLISALFCKVHQ